MPSKYYKFDDDVLNNLADHFCSKFEITKKEIKDCLSTFENKSLKKKSKYKSSDNEKSSDDDKKPSKSDKKHKCEHSFTRTKVPGKVCEKSGTQKYDGKWYCTTHYKSASNKKKSVKAHNKTLNDKTTNEIVDKIVGKTKLHIQSVKYKKIGKKINMLIPGNFVIEDKSKSSNIVGYLNDDHTEILPCNKQQIKLIETNKYYYDPTKNTYDLDDKKSKKDKSKKEDKKSKKDELSSSSDDDKKSKKEDKKSKKDELSSSSSEDDNFTN